MFKTIVFGGLGLFFGCAVMQGTLAAKYPAPILTQDQKDVIARNAHLDQCISLITTYNFARNNLVNAMASNASLSLVNAYAIETAQAHAAVPLDCGLRRDQF